MAITHTSGLVYEPTTVYLDLLKKGCDQIRTIDWWEHPVGRVLRICRIAKGMAKSIPNQDLMELRNMLLIEAGLPTDANPLSRPSVNMRIHRDGVMVTPGTENINYSSNDVIISHVLSDDLYEFASGVGAANKDRLNELIKSDLVAALESRMAHFVLGEQVPLLSVGSRIPLSDLSPSAIANCQNSGRVFMFGEVISKTQAGSLSSDHATALFEALLNRVNPQAIDLVMLATAVDHFNLDYLEANAKSIGKRLALVGDIHKHDVHGDLIGKLPQAVIDAVYEQPKIEDQVTFPRREPGWVWLGKSAAKPLLPGDTVRWRWIGENGDEVYKIKLLRRLLASDVDLRTLTLECEHIHSYTNKNDEVAQNIKRRLIKAAERIACEDAALFGFEPEWIRDQLLDLIQRMVFIPDKPIYVAC